MNIICRFWCQCENTEGKAEVLRSKIKTSCSNASLPKWQCKKNPKSHFLSPMKSELPLGYHNA